MERDRDLAVRHELVEEVDHHVAEADPREGPEGRGDDRVERPLQGEGRQQVLPEEAEGPRDAEFRFPLLREHDEDVHDEEDAREDPEGSHHEEQFRRIAADLDGLGDAVRLHGVDAQVEVVDRDAQAEVRRDVVRDPEAVRDSSDVRDAHLVDCVALVERDLGPPQVHEEERTVLVGRGALVADDGGHGRVDEGLVRRPVEQGELLTDGRVQIRRRPFVRIHGGGVQGIRGDGRTVAGRQGPEGGLPRRVESHHGDLLIPLVAGDVADRHDLQERRREAVDRRPPGREVRGNLGRVGLGEGDQLAVELVRHDFVDRAEPDVDVLEEDVAQGVADDQARRDDGGADEQPREDDQDPGRSPADVPRREAGQERATREDDGGEDDPHEDRKGREVGNGHRLRTPGSPRRSGRSSSGGCDGPASSRSRRG